MTRTTFFFIALGSSTLITFAACSDDTAVPPVTVPDASSDATAAETEAPDGPAPPAGGAIGAKCTGDADCASGLTCWRENDGSVRWPASGMCTAECTIDRDCEARAPGARCWKWGAEDKRYCHAGCSIGDNANGLTVPLKESKCFGRAELGCWKPTDGPTMFCRPSCNDDSACAPSGKCDLGSGLCTKTPRGDATGIGTGYSRDGGTAVECATGFPRIDTTADVLFCSANCTLGVLPACGWSGTGKANAGCMFGPVGARAGDLGTCAELCDCDADCRAPLLCRKIDPVFANAYGRAGVCGGSTQPLNGCADGG